MSLDDKHIGFIGAGAMAGALAGGLLASGIADTRGSASDPDPERANQLAEKLGIRVGDNNAALVEESDVVVVAVKPAVVPAALKPLRAAGVETSRPLWISIAAGVTLASLEAAVGKDARIVRAMPNTPAAVGRGMTVLCANSAVSAAQREVCGALLAAVGETAWVEDEALLDPVTAVSGGGPAYVFLLIECLAEAGAAAGLPTDLAMRLARVTVAGAGELVHRAEEPAATLRENVTSPGGTTLEALKVLMAPDGLRPLMTRAIAEATRRSRELAS